MWIRYHYRGRLYRESSGSTKLADARRLRNRRLAEMGQGRLVGADVEKTTFQDLAAMLVDNYQANGRRSLKRIKHAHFAMLAEHNARTGFFERSEFEAVLFHLPGYLQPLMSVAFITGRRAPSELCTRQRRHLDLEHGWLRLEPGQTKNEEGRQFPLIPELREIIESATADFESYLAPSPICPVLSPAATIKGFSPIEQSTSRQFGAMVTEESSKVPARWTRLNLAARAAQLRIPNPLANSNRVELLAIFGYLAETLLLSAAEFEARA